MKERRWNKGGRSVEIKGCEKDEVKKKEERKMKIKGG